MRLFTNIRNLLILLILGSLWGCKTFTDTEDMLWPVREGRLYGYINASGETVIAPQFAYAMPFSEGLGAVNVGGTPENNDMPVDGKWGFINKEGHFVINPTFYSPENGGRPYDLHDLAQVMHEGYMFSEGLAAVRNASGWVYIDTLGIEKFTLPGVQSARRFSEGLAAIYRDGKWGYINRDSVVIEPQFIFPANFKNNRALVIDKESRLISINRQGERMLGTYRLESNFYEGVAIAQEGFKKGDPQFTTEYKYGLVDTAGRFLFSPQFDQMGRYGSGLAPALVGSKVGEKVPYFDHVRADDHIGGKWGFVNRRGEFVINPVYEDAKGFNEGLAAVKKGGLWGYMNVSGNMVTGYEFRWVGYFNKGLAKVKLGPTHNDYDFKYAYINREGDVLWIEH